MSTAVTRYVNTASVGGDGTTSLTSGATAAYATLAAAFADIAADYPSFVAADVEVTLLCTGGADASMGMFLNGITTDATHRFIIRAHPNDVAEPIWNTAKYRLVDTSAGNGFSTNIVFISFECLQIEWNTSSDDASVFATTLGYNGGVGVIGIDRCHIRTTSGHANRRGISPNTHGAKGYITNCIFDGFPLSIVHNAADTAWYYYNNTIVNCGYGVYIESAGSNAIVKNTGVSAASVTCFVGTVGTGSTNNASSDSTALGTSARVNVTPTFVGSGDYTPSVADTAWTGYGTDLSADAVQPISTDIEGIARSTWDVGAVISLGIDGGGGNSGAYYSNMMRNS
jgi:hypothetical protein